ncbi:hypothetical protein BGZ98_004929 [Dissophora globulifera]|nr:hypothetical protein BGZ98_004929 [Dissophora globulifera]
MANPTRRGAEQQQPSYIPHDLSGESIAEDSEHTPLLPSDNASTSASAAQDPTTIYVKILAENLPRYKRPSALWLLPIFGLTAVGAGMLTSSIGQFQTALLCREYMNRYPPTNTTQAFTAPLMTWAAEGARSGEMFLRSTPECEASEIQAFTAKIMAVIEVLGGVTGTLSIGYYTSLSDKHGRVKMMIIGFVNLLFLLCSVIAMSKFWDQIGLPLLVIVAVVNGLMGGVGMSGTMCLAYAADCTDPGRRSLVFSWLHAGLFLGLAVGPFLGGLIVQATGSILTIIYICIVGTVSALLMLIFLMPESLPSKQAPHIRKLYEQATQDHTSGTNKTSNAQEQPIAWYAHVRRSLGFFKPNGRNTNLILLAAISFVQMLALRGTFSVIILYTNKVFHWTEYEDGILFSLGSSIRLLSLLILLPVLVHLYHARVRWQQAKKDGVKADKATGSRQYRDATEQHQGNNNGTLTNHPEQVFGADLEDPAVASSVEHLGEAALNLSDDEDSFQERRRRQSTVDSATTWSSDRTRRPSSSAPASPSSVNTKKSSSQGSPSSSEPQLNEKKLSDLKLDTWIVRLGFMINSSTYIGYGLATKGWHFYFWSSLHAFGAALGAIQVVDSIAGVFSPLVISWVYALTVDSRPEFVWYCCAALTATCTVLSFMIRQKRFMKDASVL